MPAVKTGLEVLLEAGHPRLDGKRVGLVTNHSAVDRALRSAVDLLNESDAIELVALFGPEHGVRGDAQAGVRIGGSIDPWTNLPVFSLYGETQKPDADALIGIELLVFDLQDIGVRYATYISTMRYCMEAAAEHDLDFVVLDRPNPLNGLAIAGNLLEPAFTSFVGTHPLPIRHGMTAGELALLLASDLGMPEPVIVSMRGWRRSMWFDDTGMPWVQPSPNLPTLDSVTLYPGTCLIEGTNISEGRGTTRPFEYVGAPWIDPFSLAEDLKGRDVQGVRFRPSFFSPTFSKFAGATCGGIQIHIVDREAMHLPELGVYLLHAVREIDPNAFTWRTDDSGEFFIDKLIGTDSLRKNLEAGVEPDEIVESWVRECEVFRHRSRPYLLYD